jgi:hypothetical protein
MPYDPVDHRQQTLTFVSQLKCLQRTSAKPCQQRRLPRAHEGEQPAETRRVATLADHRQRAVQIVDPNRLRHALNTQDTVIELAPFDSDLRDSDKLSNPCAYGLETLGKFGRSRSLQDESQRKRTAGPQAIIRFFTSDQPGIRRYIVPVANRAAQ